MLVSANSHVKILYVIRPIAIRVIALRFVLRMQFNGKEAGNGSIGRSAEADKSLCVSSNNAMIQVSGNRAFMIKHVNDADAPAQG
jgi:hypothetical protein